MTGFYILTKKCIIIIKSVLKLGMLKKNSLLTENPLLRWFVICYKCLGIK